MLSRVRLCASASSSTKEVKGGLDLTCEKSGGLSDNSNKCCLLFYHDCYFVICVIIAQQFLKD